MSQMPQGTEALEFDLLDRLHKTMRTSGKTAGELAEDLGVHRNTIGNYLSGKTALDRRTLIAWAFSTGVPVEWLETGRLSAPTPGPGHTIDKLARLTAKKTSRGRLSDSPEYPTRADQQLAA